MKAVLTGKVPLIIMPWYPWCCFLLLLWNVTSFLWQISNTRKVPRCRCFWDMSVVLRTFLKISLEGFFCYFLLIIFNAELKVRQSHYVGQSSLNMLTVGWRSTNLHYFEIPQSGIFWVLVTPIMSFAVNIWLWRHPGQNLVAWLLHCNFLFKDYSVCLWKHPQVHPLYVWCHLGLYHVAHHVSWVCTWNSSLALQ